MEPRSAALATCSQRIVDTPTETARPLLWTVPFSIGRFWSAAHRSTAAAPCEDFALNVLTSGAYEQHSRGESLLVDGSQVTLLNLGQVYRSRPLLDEDTHGIYLRIHPGLVPVMMDAAGRVGDRLPRRGPRLSRTLLRQWHGLWRDAVVGMTPDALYDSALALCLDLLQAEVPPPLLSRAIRRRVEAVQLHLSAHPGSSETLDALADGVGWSRFQLCRWFRAHTGTTVHRYREALRMNRAVQHLMDPTADLTGLALSLGYTSHSHFTARFGRVFGVPPSRFRAQM